MNTAITTVGIIGLGSFGSLVASLVPRYVRVLGYDPHPTQIPKNVTRTTLAEVCAADVLVVAVPLDVYPAVLPVVRKHLTVDTLVVDVCSVKQKPEALLAKHLPDHPNILLTHPLFGPQSAAASTTGHRLIVTKSRGVRAKQVIQFCQKTLGLQVDAMSSEAHDRTMAQVHALTFFVAKALADMQLPDPPFGTPSYNMLTDLVRFSHTHSEALFDTIEHGNAFAPAIRAAFQKSVHDLANALDRRYM